MVTVVYTGGVAGQGVHQVDQTRVVHPGYTILTPSWSEVCSELRIVQGEDALGSGPSCSLGKVVLRGSLGYSCPASSEESPGLLARARIKNGR